MSGAVDLQVRSLVPGVLLYRSGSARRRGRTSPTPIECCSSVGGGLRAKRRPEVCLGVWVVTRRSFRLQGSSGAQETSWRGAARASIPLRSPRESARRRIAGLESWACWLTSPHVERACLSDGRIRAGSLIERPNRPLTCGATAKLRAWGGMTIPLSSAETSKTRNPKTLRCNTLPRPDRMSHRALPTMLPGYLVVLLQVLYTGR